MTLDEAIKHAEEVAEEKFNNAVSIMDSMKSDIALSNAEECKLCAEEHRQLAEWLKDYKRLKEQEARKGHWINKHRLFNPCSCSAECSSCHKRSNGYMRGSKFGLVSTYYDFCPKCGSDNREVEK